MRPTRRPHVGTRTTAIEDDLLNVGREAQRVVTDAAVLEQQQAGETIRIDHDQALAARRRGKVANGCRTLQRLL